MHMTVVEGFAVDALVVVRPSFELVFAREAVPKLALGGGGIGADEAYAGHVWAR